MIGGVKFGNADIPSSVLLNNFKSKEVPPTQWHNSTHLKIYSDVYSPEAISKAIQDKSVNYLFTGKRADNCPFFQNSTGDILILKNSATGKNEVRLLAHDDNTGKLGIYYMEPLNPQLTAKQALHQIADSFSDVCEADKRPHPYK